MDPNDYTVLFNIARMPFTGWGTGAYCLLFALGITAAALAEVKIKRILMLAGAALVAFSGISWTWMLWSEYVHLRREFSEGRVVELEGYVRDFQHDRKVETFEIAGRRFELWQAEATMAFHQSATEGGPNLAGLCMRVFFIPHHTGRDRIVWLGARKKGCAEPRPQGAGPVDVILPKSP